MNSSKNNDKTTIFNNAPRIEVIPLYHDFKDNYAHISKRLNHTGDLKKHSISIHNNDLMLVYIETIIDKNILHEHVIKPLLTAEKDTELSSIIQTSIVDLLTTNNLSQAVDYITNGSVLLFIQGSYSVFTINVKNIPNRSITESTTEKIVKGSHDGFIENLNININLIRTRINSPNLTIKYYTLGKQSPTKTAMVYIKDIATEQAIQEIEHRIESISTNHIIPSSYVEEIIQDMPLSPFPQILNTERPDRVMASLLEGRIVFLEDNSANALIMPVNFFSFYQSPDDYHSRWLLGTFFRLIRLLGFLIAILLPSIYVAIIGFHYEVLPDELILPIKSSIQGIPYPPIIEAILMELILELIREAGIRLPNVVGQTIGIVGGLVIGEAIVKVGLVSNTMIVVVSITAISAFVIPSVEMSNAIRLLRFSFLIPASIIGFPGIVFVGMIILIHLCKLESFGQPYFYPVAPLNMNGLLDAFSRKMVWNKKG
jgi:spore germination protein KA